ncbi:MAG: lipocalin family protein, partial [Gemmatimonadota bacterium]|nr:lipocalin family protein [Gemmatimonadota bacterium]
PPELDSAWSTGQAIMGHAAVTDLATGRHVFSELLYRAAPLLGGFPDAPDPRLAWSRAPAGTDGTWTLSWTGEAFAFTAVDESRDVGIDLTAEPIRPVVLHGEGGLSTKGPAAGNASLYYSFPRMATTGEIALDGERRAVRGTSWMDKEIASNALAPDQVGWDWFSLRLEDGRDLMLYALRRADGTVDHATGTLVGVDGSARPLEGEAFEIEATGSWTSPVTGSVYPSGWRIAVPSAGIELAVEPVVEAQENVSELLPDLHYWEGVVVARDAAGRVAGRGYVELTGYGEDSRPAL